MKLIKQYPNECFFTAICMVEDLNYEKVRNDLIEERINDTTDWKYHEEFAKRYAPWMQKIVQTRYNNFNLNTPTTTDSFMNNDLSEKGIITIYSYVYKLAEIPTKKYINGHSLAFENGIIYDPGIEKTFNSIDELLNYYRNLWETNNIDVVNITKKPNPNLNKKE